MYDVFSAVVLAGVLGAQWVLTLVLLKGDICPGQRGRLHTAFWYLVAGWAVTVPFSPFSALPFVTLGLFSLRSKSGKTRQSGPVPVLHLANGFGALAFIMVVLQHDVYSALLMVSQLALVGAVTAHCLLVKARSRLQAFHRILPVVGIVAAMLMALTLAMASASVGDVAVDTMMYQVLFSLALMLGGVLVWALHLFRQVAPTLLPLMLALLALSTASGVAMAAVL